MLRLKPGQPGARVHAFTLPLNYHPLLPAIVLHLHVLKLCEALKLHSWIRPGSWSQRIHRLIGERGIDESGAIEGSAGHMSEAQRTEKPRLPRREWGRHNRTFLSPPHWNHYYHYYLPHFETIMCVPSLAWGTLGKNNCLFHLWINNIMTFPTDLSHEYEWNTIHLLKAFSILRVQRQGLHSNMRSRDVWRWSEVLRWQTPYTVRVLI